jgi:dTDP-4-dehydrorhamnose reductase
LVDIDECEKWPNVAFEKNVLLTRNVVQACGEETKIVYISSDQVYGGIYPKNEEQRDLKSRNVYGATKLAGEKEAVLHSLKSLVIRTNIFGVNLKTDRVSFSEWALYALKNSQPIHLFTDYIFSPIVGPHYLATCQEGS